MGFRQAIRMALDEYYEDLTMALNGLSAEERRFQPGPESHHIDFAVWHMARVEDIWIQGFARGVEQLWTRDGWSGKLGIPASDSGHRYDADKVRNLPRFELSDIIEYYESARKETFGFLESVAEEDLDRCPDPDRRPGYTVGRMFGHIVVEQAQHTGRLSEGPPTWPRPVASVVGAGVRGPLPTYDPFESVPSAPTSGRTPARGRPGSGAARPT